jgi:hypothetical protein
MAKKIRVIGVTLADSFRNAEEGGIVNSPVNDNCKEGKKECDPFRKS